MSDSLEMYDMNLNVKFKFATFGLCGCTYFKLSSAYRPDGVDP